MHKKSWVINRVKGYAELTWKNWKKHQQNRSAYHSADKKKFWPDMSVATITSKNGNLKTFATSKMGTSTNWCQFHQHFTYEFFVRTSSFRQLFLRTYVHMYVKKSCRNNVRTNFLYVKWWWNWHLPSISSTFYARVFRTKVTFWQLF